VVVELARYVVDAVVVEGRSVRDVARCHGVSKSWVSVLVCRYREGGYEAIAPRSKRPQRLPRRTPDDVEDAIVRIRKELSGHGYDAGPETIAWHLRRQGRPVPSTSTIWRILVRRGLVVPEPKKRPKASFVRFEAALPNQCWQSDVTHWTLADGSHVEILNFEDDHSRVCLASRVFRTVGGHDVLTVFHDTASTWGFPASVLTDNGAIYNAQSRKGTTVFESELERRGIVYKHSRPYHPQTCGKVERFHQTLKQFLQRQRPARSLRVLQHHIDRFVEYYNHSRPHRAVGRRTPFEAYNTRDKAGPRTPLGTTHFRVRTDKVDNAGKVTLRHDSKLLHIGIGRRHHGTPIRLYVADLDVRVITLDGQLLRHLQLDSTHRYQGQDREVH
jgi:transposase InsO family protein